MSEEFKDNLEVTEDTIEEYIPETVHEEPVIEIEAEVQPEAVLTQAEDGSWRHADNSPFSPFYVPDRKQKNNNRLTIGLIIMLLLLLVGCLIFAVSKLIEAAVGEATDAWNDSTGAVEEFWDNIKNYFDEETDDYDNYDYDDYDDYDYESDVYIPSPDDEYYVELADAIRDDLSYSVTIEKYENHDYDSAYTWVWYAQVSDNVANSDIINECLLENAMYYAEQFERHEIQDVSLTVVSYVAYMDEDILSVVVNENYIVSGEYYAGLRCLNFDVKTGTLLNNTDLITVSDKLVDAFIEQSLYQNGEISSMAYYSEEEIKDFMREEENLILFYTPVGLEIGFNHPYGWVTATLKEYEQFLKRL